MGRSVQRLGSNLGESVSQFSASGRQGRAQVKFTEVKHGAFRGEQARFMKKLGPVVQFKESR